MHNFIPSFPGWEEELAILRSRNRNLQEKAMWSRVSKQIWTGSSCVLLLSFFLNCFVSYHSNQLSFFSDKQSTACSLVFGKVYLTRRTFVNICYPSLRATLFNLPVISPSTRSLFLMFWRFHNLSEKTATFLQLCKNHFWAVHVHLENSQLWKKTKFSNRAPQ